jgi:hypothetical protein
MSGFFLHSGSNSFQKLESKLAAWFRKAHETNSCIDGTHFKEKALHITAHLGIAKFNASNGWIDRLRRQDIVYRNLRVSGGRRSVDPETVED